MKAFTLCLAVSCLATTALAQTKPAAKSAAKPAVTRTTTAAKPTAKPAAKPVTTAKPATTARPTATEAAAAPVAPKSAPATKSAPAAKTSMGASASTFGKGTTVANLGVGVGINYGNSFVVGASKSIPALSLSVERGIREGLGPGVIGAGGLLVYKSNTWGSGEYRLTERNMYVGVRGTYHYNFTDNEKLDTYAGLSLGARIQSYSDNGYYSNTDSWGGTYLTTGLFLGARYYVTEKIGGFAEVGYDMSLLKLGVSARF
ncbi:hypothetical protein [Hymenobacter guriensis]|uniref:Outer membrane protein beta-barrel domain-containing protein n=1 Tax=Hymenobacter guriensis TaxID=2793065 RepID=A0ABS0KYU3_9BACT|nr:hypothetical protein [Hymenobacter guriensis]MBG8553008.1 hypothetical protein [Hymenobacter guriensis]